MGLLSVLVSNQCKVHFLQSVLKLGLVPVQDKLVFSLSSSWDCFLVQDKLVSSVCVQDGTGSWYKINLWLQSVLNTPGDLQSLSSYPGIGFNHSVNKCNDDMIHVDFKCIKVLQQPIRNHIFWDYSIIQSDLELKCLLVLRRC